MARRIATLTLAAMVFGLAAAGPAAAQDRSPADLFGDDTFFYVETDAKALMDGLPQLDLAKFVDDEQARDFLRPMLEKIGADLERPMASILERLPVREWVTGKVAVGIRAIGLTITRADGTVVTHEISRAKPISAALVHEVIGLAVGSALRFPDRGAVKIEPDLLISIDAGPALRAAVERHLERLPEHVTATHVEIGGRKVLKLSVEHAERKGPKIMFDLLADLDGDRWLIGTRAASFETALGGGPKASLAASPRFVKVRERLTSGSSVLLAFADLADVLAIGRNFVSPIVAEELDLLGLLSLEGLGLGISFAEGGVRETIAITTEGRRRGLLSLLDAWPGGLETLELAPASTTGFIALKFDAAKLYERLLGLARTLAPGTDKQLDAMARGFGPGGINIVEDLLPALGDEVSFFLFPPKAGPFPEAIVAMRVRDGERFGKLLDQAKARAAEAGFEARTLRMTDGDDGFMFEIEGSPVIPAFVVRDGWLFGGGNPQLLRGFCRGLAAEDRTCLRTHGETFKKVMNAVSRGRTDRVVALGYVDLKRLVPMGLSLLPMAGGMLDGFLDTALVPEIESIQPYFSGLAWAVQIDEDAVSFDLFSPAGVLPLLVGAGVMSAQQQDAEWDRAMSEMEAKRAKAEAEMRAALAEGPFVGFNTASAEAGGPVVVDSVIEGTPAAAAKLMPGDVIVGVADAAVTDFESFRTALTRFKPGDVVTIVVERDGKKVHLPVKLARRGDHADR